MNADFQQTAAQSTPTLAMIRTLGLVAAICGLIIVGAYQSDAIGMDAGRAYVYFGGRHMDGKVDLTLTGEAPGDMFGVAVAAAGDVNKDGSPDVLVGAYQNDGGGGSVGPDPSSASACTRGR